MRPIINKIENRKNKENQWNQKPVLSKDPSNDKPLAMLTKDKRKKTQVTNSRMKEVSSLLMTKRIIGD